MKKNRMLRMASALLVLTLLTTCIIGGTFAKYTTSGAATDTARVAKWGVEVKCTGNAFATEYDTDNTNVKGTIAKSVVTAAGTGADGKKLVAPGTSGKLFESSITGTPEVAVKVETSVEFTLNGWTINGSEEYCPIVISINGIEYKMGDTESQDNHVYTSISDFESAVKNALKKYDATFGPNTNLETAYNNKYDVEWYWAFEGSDANPYQSDEKDTALGNLATAPTIEFTCTTIVTQID